MRDIRPTADEIGKAKRIDDATGRYIVFCKNTFPEDLSLEGMRVVLDCAHGATYKAAPIIFAELGADVITIHASPDGTNINDRCGSQHTESLRAKVLETRAEVGLAFDGDGDRLIVVDELGRELSGDQVLVICAKRYQELGLLQNNLVISTVMSNFGFGLALKELGIEYGAAKVGDRYVLEMMQERGAVLGGEASGHTICLNHHTTGDGIISALQLVATMKTSGRPLSSLGSLMRVFPQKIVNIDVSKKPPLEDLSSLKEAIKLAEAELGTKGRVLIRYSGTQSMCRVMVEGPTEEVTLRLAQSLASTVRSCIG
jgi:phosphoglucosamine mutase